jgi:ADP-heptose:LPS heptosyltransferase
MRFDDYLDVNNIECVDFLKVEIEGSEYRLFKDISVETLQNRVNKIAIEYHWNYSDQLNIITDKLNEAGFEISTFESNSNARVGKLYAVNKRYEGKTVKRKVGIGVHSSCQSKYWNNPDGWQKVVDYLNENGFEVVLYSKEPSNYMGNVNPSNVTQFPEGSLQNVIDDLQKCEFFIGLGSGLSWLAWSVGIPVVLISGFSEEWAETKLNTHRIINKNVCHGCFNRHRLDPGDWNWCPEHKGTDRMFECTKTISADEVITKIKYLTRLV